MALYRTVSVLNDGFAQNPTFILPPCIERPHALEGSQRRWDIKKLRVMALYVLTTEKVLLGLCVIISRETESV